VNSKINTSRALALICGIMGVLTIGSIIAALYTNRMSLYETHNVTICTYTEGAFFHYAAKLSSNTIYNRSTLYPGEGPIYSAILEYLNVTGDYVFSSIPRPTNISSNPEYTVEIESPEKWTRTLSDIEAEELIQLVNDGTLRFSINKTEIQEFVESIDEDVGMRSSTYNLNILGKIHTNATVAGRTIQETFEPKLTVSFIIGGELGNYIAIDNLHQSEQSQITETYETFNAALQDNRNIANVASAINLILLGTAVAFYLELRPDGPRTRPIEKLISPYRELITETDEEPSATATIINLNTLEDLAKTAEILARPILHAHTDDRHTFYVIDEGTTYQYKTHPQPPEDT